MGKAKELAQLKEEIAKAKSSIDYLTQGTEYFQCQPESEAGEDIIIAGMYDQCQLLRKEDEYGYLTKELYERLRSVTDDSELQTDRTVPGTNQGRIS